MEAEKSQQNGAYPGDPVMEPNEKISHTNTDVKKEKLGILAKLKQDCEFRLRFMHTAFVWWGFVTLVSILQY